MRFATALTFAVSAALVAAQQNITVAVGANNTLTYNATNIVASIGDTVTFVFLSKNHTVSQSTFADPCTQFVNTTDPAAAAAPLTSGFKFVDPNGTTFPIWSVKITQAAPIWFFCAQAPHCSKGMVVSVNAPTTGNTFDAFQTKALATAPGAANTTTPSGSAIGGASATGGASASGGASPTGGAVAGSDASGSATSGAPAATQSKGSGALGNMPPAAISSALLSFVGIAFGLML